MRSTPLGDPLAAYRSSILWMHLRLPLFGSMFPPYVASPSAHSSPNFLLFLFFHLPSLPHLLSPWTSAVIPAYLSLADAHFCLLSNEDPTYSLFPLPLPCSSGSWPMRSQYGHTGLLRPPLCLLTPFHLHPLASSCDFPQTFLFKFFPRSLPPPITFHFQDKYVHTGLLFLVPPHVFPFLLPFLLCPLPSPFSPPVGWHARFISTVIPAYCAAVLSSYPSPSFSPCPWGQLGGIPPLYDSRVYGLMRLLGTSRPPFFLFIPFLHSSLVRARAAVALRGSATLPLL